MLKRPIPAGWGGLFVNEALPPREETARPARSATASLGLTVHSSGGATSSFSLSQNPATHDESVLSRAAVASGPAATAPAFKSDAERFPGAAVSAKTVEEDAVELADYLEIRYPQKKDEHGVALIRHLDVPSEKVRSRAWGIMRARDFEFEYHPETGVEGRNHDLCFISGVFHVKPVGKRRKDMGL